MSQGLFSKKLYWKRAFDTAPPTRQKNTTNHIRLSALNNKFTKLRVSLKHAFNVLEKKGTVETMWNYYETSHAEIWENLEE